LIHLKRFDVLKTYVENTWLGLDKSSFRLYLSSLGPDEGELLLWYLETCEFMEDDFTYNFFLDVLEAPENLV
jgi:hypothetical protein